ncbi:hypothetical protein [uncultured Sphingomonas sp.]|uniref:hypothetical protein n=1 Tax=uncultured Sphingomonas sp. TaxID=158754 RepID=UPI0025FE00CF|nr:hypothetical protein [uncultured Sphingomonas sp.]
MTLDEEPPERSPLGAEHIGEPELDCIYDIDRKGIEKFPKYPDGSSVPIFGELQKLNLRIPLFSRRAPLCVGVRPQRLSWMALAFTLSSCTYLLAGDGKWGRGIGAGVVILIDPIADASLNTILNSAVHSRHGVDADLRCDLLASLPLARLSGSRQGDVPLSDHRERFLLRLF